MQYTIESYNKKLSEARPDIRCLGLFYGVTKQARHECLTCGHLWMVMPRQVLYERKKCPVCKHEERKQHFLTNLTEISTSIKCVGDFIDVATYSEFYCVDCDKLWVARPSMLLQDGHKCRVKA